MSQSITGVTEAARELQIDRRTLIRWIAAGDVKAEKVGSGRTNAYAITRDELDRVKAEVGKS